MTQQFQVKIEQKKEEERNRGWQIKEEQTKHKLEERLDKR